MSSYFEELERVIKKYNLQDKPHLIFNVDEKGITQNHSPPHIVSDIDYHPQSVTSGKSQTTTILDVVVQVGLPFHLSLSLLARD